MKHYAKIYRDEVIVAEFEITTGFEILRWFHNHVPSCSMDWAIKNEGYRYEIWAVINEERKYKIINY